MATVVPGMPGWTQSNDSGRDLDDLYGTDPDNASSPRSNHSSPGSPRPNGSMGIDQSRRRRGPSERYRREKEHAHSGASRGEVLRLLIDQEYEVEKTRKALYTSLERLQIETERANEAERARTEMLGHFRLLNESRAKALREAEKATQELRMYQIQYGNAQREINRAQEVLKILQEQKDDAERSASRARRIARELNQNRLVTEAREEGRRLGFAAGFRRAQKELGLTDGDASESGTGTNVDEAVMEMDLRGGGDRLGPVEFYHDDHLVGSERDESVTQPQSQPPFTAEEPTHRSPPPSEPIPITQPVPQRAPPLSQSPAVQVYNLPIPSADQIEAHPRRPSSTQPPDNYIPQSTDMGFIPLPPPFEFTTGSRYPQIPPVSPHSPSIKLPPMPPDETTPVRARDYAYTNTNPAQSNRPPSGPLPNPHPVTKTNSSHSRRHSTGSGSTSSRISQIDLVKNVSGGDRNRILRPRPERELSMVREDVGSSRIGSPSHQRSRSMMSHPSQGSFGGRNQGNGIIEPNLSSLAEQVQSRPSSTRQQVEQNNGNQRIADDLRYSNSAQVDEWRKAGSQQPVPQRDRPPRHYPRPAILTVPAPLSPPADDRTGAGPSTRHIRSVSDASSSFYAGGNRRAHNRTTSNHSLASSLGKPIAGIFSTLARSVRKEPLEELEEITINVDPPSGPSSGRTNFQQPLQQDNYLSPQRGPAPLPVSTGSPAPSVRGQGTLVPTVPNTPTMPSQPMYWPDQRTQDAHQGGYRTVPHGPRGPSRSRSPSPHHIPFPANSPNQPPGNLVDPEPLRPTPRTRLRRISTPASMAASTAGGSDANGQTAGRNVSRSGSVVNPGATPSSVNYVLPQDRPAGTAPSNSGHSIHRVASNASFASFDQNTYLDPAYYGPEQNAIPRPASRSR